MTYRRARLFPLFLALASCTGLVIDPGDPPAPTTESGIVLSPPTGIGTRALMCNPDYAPLRRLNHVEYQNTLADLFAGVEMPPTTIGPDARRSGFTNNFQVLNPSTLLVTQYHENASAIARTSAGPLVASLGCSPGADCYRQLIEQFGARAFRRPLTAEEIDGYLAFFESGPAAGDFELATEMALHTMLQAPAFIYRPELGAADGKLTQYEIASRLSYFIWGTMPDAELFEAAEQNRLQGASLAPEVDRMMEDPRARTGLLHAMGEWLELDRLETTLKAEEYEWTPEIRADLRESFERFVWERVMSDGGSLDAMMTSTGAYVNARIGPIFGIEDAGEEMEWREVEHRSGILTHPAILATHGYGTYPSPVRRGVFILTELLCDPPQPPPQGIEMGEPPTEDQSGTPLTNREGYVELTQSDAQCANCHDQINPFGYALEHYDTVGAYREMDNGYAVDASGSSNGFTLQSGFEFEDGLELAAQMNESARVRACVVDRWIRYASGGGSLAYDPCLREELEELAASPDVSLRDLVIAIAVHPKFAAAEVVRE